MATAAAVAEPTLNLQSTQDESAWKNAPERTAYQAATRVEPIADNGPDYSFNP